MTQTLSLERINTLMFESEASADQLFQRIQMHRSYLNVLSAQYGHIKDPEIQHQLSEFRRSIQELEEIRDRDLVRAGEYRQMAEEFSELETSQAAAQEEHKRILLLPFVWYRKLFRKEPK